MEVNTINLVVRFILEMSGLITLGVWGWDKGDDVARFILAPGVPLIAATIWGVFAVVDDPVRSGNAPVIVSGIIRLIIELSFFGLVVWALFIMDYSMLGWLLGVVAVVHYVVSYERVLWLLQQ